MCRQTPKMVHQVSCRTKSVMVLEIPYLLQSKRWRFVILSLQWSQNRWEKNLDAFATLAKKSGIGGTTKKGQKLKCHAGQQKFITSRISGRGHRIEPVCVGLWELHCAPLRGYRTMLYTINLCCAPPSCVVQHGAQGGPMSVRRWCTRRFCIFVTNHSRYGAQYDVTSLTVSTICCVCCVNPSWQKDFWAKALYLRGTREVCESSGIFIAGDIDNFRGEKLFCSKMKWIYHEERKFRLSSTIV